MELPEFIETLTDMELVEMQREARQLGDEGLKTLVLNALGGRQGKKTTPQKYALYRHKETGWALRLTHTDGGYYELRSGGDKWTWFGSEEQFKEEFERNPIPQPLPLEDHNLPG